MISLLAITIETCVRRPSGRIAFLNLHMGMVPTLTVYMCVFPRPPGNEHLFLILVESQEKFAGFGFRVRLSVSPSVSESHVCFSLAWFESAQPTFSSLGPVTRLDWLR